MPFRLDRSGILRWEAWDARDWLVHGFTTKFAGDLRGMSADETAGRAGDQTLELISVRQVHSSRVVKAGDVDPADPPEADALIETAPGRLLATYVADCAPILLADPETHSIAAVHAGWRGSAAGIASRAVEALVRNFGVAPRNLEALLGPCVGAAAYEVSEEVAAQFEPEAVVRKPEWRKPHVDLPAANRRQLEQAGLIPANIFGGDLCTVERPDWFYSYRREGQGTGRMAGLIGVRR